MTTAVGAPFGRGPWANLTRPRTIRLLLAGATLAMIVIAGCREDATSNTNSPLPPSTAGATPADSPASHAERPPSNPMQSPPVNQTQSQETRTAIPREPRFTDVTAQSGIDFIHDTGRDESKPNHYFFPEIMSGGACVFDADGDDRLDIYFVNARKHTDSSNSNASKNRLFRQVDDFKFTDITDASGLGDPGYGMGCAVGDIDNDGDTDIYVTNHGPDKLFTNDGKGTFTDATKIAGIENETWSASVAFCDFDIDGWLDIYVTNYLDHDPEKTCSDKSGRPDYCGPNAFPGVPDTLFRNKGGGVFENTSRQAGIATVRDAGLGLVATDFTDDGFIDFYIANDADPNNLWVNLGDARFIDEAMMRGAAFNAHGQSEAGMGVTIGDTLGANRDDIFVTHLIEETNTFYKNIGAGDFEDATATANLGLASVTYTGFGTAFFDSDNDGDLDLAVANGAVKRRSKPLTQSLGFWNDYAEPNLFLENTGQARFVDAADSTGDFATPILTSRGLLPADLDNDGDLDLIVTNLNAPPNLYRNNTINPTSTNPAAWIKIIPYDPNLRRPAIGARVTIHTRPPTTTSDSRQSATLTNTFGYLTSIDAPLHFGLGAATRVEKIEIRWPGGSREIFDASPVRQTLKLEKGSGRSE